MGPRVGVDTVDQSAPARRKTTISRRSHPQLK